MIFSKNVTQFFLLLIFLLYSCFVFSGIFRTVFDITLATSRLLSVLTHLAFLVYLLNEKKLLFDLNKFLPRKKELFIFLFLTLIPTLIYIAINQFSLIELGTGDAYHHFKVLNRFEFRYPNAYHGFVSVYALVLAVKDIFSLNIYQAFIAVIYFNFFYTLSLLYLIFFKIGNLKLNFTNILTFLIITFFVLIPVYFEYIGQGGFVHAVSIFILPTFAFLYAFIERPFLRVILLGLFPIILRYTYGLNLSDVILTSTVLLILEFNLIKYLNYKFIKAIVFIVGILASSKAYIEIIKIIKQGGSGTNINSNLIFLFVLIFVFAYFIYKKSLYRERVNLNKQQIRLFNFSSILASITVVTELSFLFIENKYSYYDYKYISNITILISFVSIIFYFKIFNRILIRFSIILSFIVLIVLAMYDLHYNSYVKDKHKLFKFNEINAIEAVLTSLNKKFGGFICHSWPRFRIVNHHFGKVNSTSFKYYSQKGKAIFKLKENQCIFWQNSKKDREALAKVMGGIGAYKRMEKFKEIALLQKREGKFTMIDSKSVSESQISYVCN